MNARPAEIMTADNRAAARKIAEHAAVDFLKNEGPAPTPEKDG